MDKNKYSFVITNRCNLKNKTNEYQNRQTCRYKEQTGGYMERRKREGQDRGMGLTDTKDYVENQ